MNRYRWLSVLAAFALLVAACGDDDETGDATSSTAGATTTVLATTAAPDTTQAPGSTEGPGDMPEMRSLSAPMASITVDGDASDWAGIPGLDMTLEPIKGESSEEKAASVWAAHDGEYLYVLMTVDDDFDWNADDPHLSASPSVMWAIDAAAGPHMGTDDLEGEGPSMGMVDIWHWELECAVGENQGGAVSGPGDGKPAGNDAGCNFDDEFSTDPEERYDDGDTEGPAGSGAENSLLGVFTHTNATAGADGTWTFEMRRPLQTGDSQDAQFTVGGTGLMALAYWDADNSPEGWDDAEHVQSSNKGWIEVLLVR
ncbi:MAG: ethylbenzene dehydrogenase-related protein [Acidimicrobiia bacterium]